MSYRLGIDLGTTATAAAFGDGGDISVLSLGHASLSIPSVAAVDADGALLFGDEAAHRLSSSPTSGVREFKRRFGDPIPALVDGVPQPAEDLMAGLFRHVLARVEEQRGEQPESITVTHPANWGEYKRQLLTDSLRACTDVPLTLLAEPEAAAQHYALQERVPAGTLIAVYDLGGGTLDTAVLQKTVDGWTRLGPALGVDQLGGVDFDDLVVTHVRRHLGLGDDVALDPDPAVQSALSQLRHDCRSAKEVLSSRTSADVASLVPGHVGQIRITRSEFEEMARPLITQSVEVLADTIAAANLEPRQVDRILLVGGSSRVPLVSEIIANRLGIPVSIDVHSKHAVSLGAAAGDRPEVSSVVPQSRPTLDDASSASGAVQPNSVSEPQPLRLETHGSPAQRNRRGVIAALAIGVAAIAAVAAFVVTRGGGDAPEAAPGAEGGDDVEPVVAGSPASSDAAVTGTLVGSLGTPGQTNVHPVAGPARAPAATWRLTDPVGATLINGETMYVASQSGSLDSFDVANGRLNWSIPHADFFSRIYHDGEDLYTAHPLRRIDGLTGEVLEEIDVPDHDSDEWPVETMAASDGLFLVMRHRSTSRFSLVRLSPTREMLWQVALDDTGWAGNAPIIIDGLAIVGLEESVVAFDVASGEQRWRVSSSFAHVAAAEGNVILIDVAARMTVHDARTGDERFRLNVTAVQHPVVADGQVFAAVADRSVRAFDLASLEEVWRTDDVLSLPVEGLVADESAIYAVSHNSIDGVLEAASLDRGSGEIVWSSTLGEERPGAMLGNQMVLPGEGALAVLEADGQISVWG